MSEEVKEVKEGPNFVEGRMSFHCMTHEDPTIWIDYPVSNKLSNEEYNIWAAIQKIFVHEERDENGELVFSEEGDTTILKSSRKPFHHPCVRFEDAIANLLMQLSAIPEVDKYREGTDGKVYRVKWVSRKVKAARQYGNQMLKKICRNCRFQINEEKYISHYIADPERDYTLLENYASMIENNDCHKNCNSCRVATSILLAVRVEEFIFGYDMMYSELRKTAVLWRNRAMVKAKELKKLKFVHGKVLESKRDFSRAYHASERDRARMQKENDGLRGYKTTDANAEDADYIRMNMTIPEHLYMTGPRGKIPKKEFHEEYMNDPAVPKKPSEVMPSSRIPTAPMGLPAPPPVKEKGKLIARAVFDEFNNVPKSEAEISKMVADYAKAVGGKVVMGSVPDIKGPMTLEDVKKVHKYIDGIIVKGNCPECGHADTRIPDKEYLICKNCGIMTKIIPEKPEEDKGGDPITDEEFFEDITLEDLRTDEDLTPLVKKIDEEE